MTGDWRFWPPVPPKGGKWRAAPHASKTAKCAGYNIVVLAVAITVLNILVAKALPLWSTVIQREKEEELIFRGLQYAEAIRLFEGRAQRLPTRLEELIESKPRSIRKLWKNPMTEDGGWALVLDGQGKNLAGQNPNQNQNPNQGRSSEQQGQVILWVPGDESKKIGGNFQIVGVYSPEGGEAIKVFAPFGGGSGTEISEWRFTKDLLQGLGVGAGMQASAPDLNAANIGKPWPPGLTPPAKLRPDRGGHAGLSGPLDRNQPGRDVGGGPGQRPANGQGGG